MDLQGFGPGGYGPSFEPISKVELLDWAVLGPIWEFWAWVHRGYSNGFRGFWNWNRVILVLDLDNFESISYFGCSGLVQSNLDIETTQGSNLRDKSSFPPEKFIENILFRMAECGGHTSFNAKMDLAKFGV